MTRTTILQVQGQNLLRRAQALACVRQHFYETHAVEADVGVLSTTTTQDRYIDSLSSQTEHQGRLFLQTSPELSLKRLLAKTQCDLYYLGSAFRDECLSPQHQIEFTMLEWYRCHDVLSDLIEECLTLLQKIAQRPLHVEYTTLTQALSPWNIDIRAQEGLHVWHEALMACQLSQAWWQQASEPEALDVLLYEHFLRARPEDTLTVITDFAPSQAAMAQINAEGYAQRFEIYWGRQEIANGYLELIDADEQAQRMQQEAAWRHAQGRAMGCVDEAFLQALPQLPPCVGVALGFDRALMCAWRLSSLEQVRLTSLAPL